jgi:hypothetical protein
LLDGTAGDDKEVLPIRLREAAIAFGDVSFNGESSMIALIDEKTVAVPWGSVVDRGIAVS